MDCCLSCMCVWCEGDGKILCGDGGVVVSAGHASGTHGSGIVSSAADVLGIRCMG